MSMHAVMKEKVPVCVELKNSRRQISWGFWTLDFYAKDKADQAELCYELKVNRKLKYIKEYQFHLSKVNTT